MPRVYRKKKQRADVFPASLVGIAVLLITGGVGLSLLRARCAGVEADTARLRKEQVDLRERYTAERIQWAQMKAPQNLGTALQRWNLAMTLPRPEQVVWVSDGKASGAENLARHAPALPPSRRKGVE